MTNILIARRIATRLYCCRVSFETNFLLKRTPLMGTRSKRLRSAAIAAAITLGGCNNTVVVSPSYLGVTISPRPASIAVGATMVFTGTASNNLSLPQWSILDASLSTNSGTLTPVTGSSISILYTAPSTPPIYPVTAGVTQGTVTLNATVVDPPEPPSPSPPTRSPLSSPRRQSRSTCPRLRPASHSPGLSSSSDTP